MRLKTKYKHLIFTDFTQHLEQEKFYYVCENKSGEYLGSVEWYEPWKQYVFNSDGGLYRESCLRDIGDFISQFEGL